MSRFGKIVTYALLIGWAIICAVPVYWVFVTSIKGPEDIDKPPGYVPFFDFTPSLDAWRFILFEHNENLASRFVNSAVIGLSAAILTLMVSAMAIYGLTRFRVTTRWTLLTGMLLSMICTGLAISVAAPSMRLAFATLAIVCAIFAAGMRRRGPIISTVSILSMILATRILPPIVLVIPLYLMALATGTRDTLSAMILVYTAANVPVAIWMLLPILGTRPTEQEEAAQLEGLSHFGIFLDVVLPMARAGVAATGLFIFVLCWNEYLLAAYLTSDNALTLPPWAVGQLSMKEAQIGGEAEEWAHLSAATMLMMVPALVFAAFVQKLVGRTAFFAKRP